MPARQVELNSELEVVGAEVEVGDRLFRFISIYLPGSGRVPPDSLKGIFCAARTLVGGDFNAKNRHWGCRSTNARGRMLNKLVQEIRDIEVCAPAEATSVPASNRRREIIDIFLAFRMTTPWEVTTHPALSSDHCPVPPKIGGDPAKDRVVCSVDWEKFKSRTEKVGSDRKPVAHGNVANVARIFTGELKAVLESCTSRKTVGRRNHIGLTSGEQEVIRAKNRAKREWSRWKRERETRSFIVGWKGR